MTVAFYFGGCSSIRIVRAARELTHDVATIHALSEASGETNVCSCHDTVHAVPVSSDRDEPS